MIWKTYVKIRIFNFAYLLFLLSGQVSNDEKFLFLKFCSKQKLSGQVGSEEASSTKIANVFPSITEKHSLRMESTV